MKVKTISAVPWFFLITLALGAYLVRLYVQADRRLAEVQAQAAAAELSWQEVRAEHDRLLKLIQDLNSDAYIEKLARERLGLIKKGEVPVLVQPNQAGTAPVRQSNGTPPDSVQSRPSGSSSAGARPPGDTN